MHGERGGSSARRTRVDSFRPVKLVLQTAEPCGGGRGGCGLFSVVFFRLFRWGSAPGELARKFQRVRRAYALLGPALLRTPRHPCVSTSTGHHRTQQTPIAACLMPSPPQEGHWTV